MTPNERELSQKLFEGPQRSTGTLGALKEALLTIAPGLKDAGREIGAELKQMGTHGAHELAAALFNGSAFVMYPRGGKDDHGVHGPEPAQDGQAPHQDAPDQHLERGGRGR